jgi:DNA-directed RNA polymerase specialized sigma24 family protein
VPACDVHRQTSTTDNTLASASSTTTTVDELSADLLPRIVRRVRRSFQHVPIDFIADAAEDALVEYVCHPQQFARAGGATPEGFLIHAAKRNLQNRLRAERRRQAREDEYARLCPRFTVLGSAGDESAFERRQVLRRVLTAVCNREELAAAVIWLRDAAGTDAIAAKLILGDLPVATRRREVKRFKDRVLKRITRYLQRHHA